MRFYWPKGQLDSYGSIANLTNIFDYPIQGMATGEIIPLILYDVWRKIDGLRARIVLTIHDSIVIEHHPDDTDEIKKILIDAFTKDIYNHLRIIYNYEFTTQLGCEIKVSKNWGEGKGEKYEAAGV